MNRTKKLMTAVASSVMLTGTLSVPWAVVPALGQTETRPDESWKTDPQVQAAADSIQPKFPCGKPLTQAEILKDFPQFDTALGEKALKKLVYTGFAQRSGDGSKDNPFRYFEPCAGHGGGG